MRRPPGHRPGPPATSAQHLPAVRFPVSARPCREEQSAGLRCADPRQPWPAVLLLRPFAPPVSPQPPPAQRTGSAPCSPRNSYELLDRSLSPGKLPSGAFPEPVYPLSSGPSRCESQLPGRSPVHRPAAAGAVVPPPRVPGTGSPPGCRPALSPDECALTGPPLLRVR